MFRFEPALTASVTAGFFKGKEVETMQELRFRIKSDIFPDWVYSESHYKVSSFFDRWEGQYINMPEYEPIMQQLINNIWVDVIPVFTL